MTWYPALPPPPQTLWTPFSSSYFSWHFSRTTRLYQSVHALAQSTCHWWALTPPSALHLGLLLAWQLGDAVYDFFCCFMISLLPYLFAWCHAFRHFFIFLHSLFTTEWNIERISKTATWSRTTEATNIAARDSLQY